MLLTRPIFNIVMYLSILYVAVFLDVTYAGRYVCPTLSQMLPCECGSNYFGLQVTCESAPVDQVRGPLAEIRKTNQPVYFLTLRNVQLPNLPSNLFVGPDVNGIDVLECNTSTVDENAFADVSAKLEWLIITGNPLAQVPSQALQKLSKLRYLFLHNNGIQVLQSESFKGLYSLLELYLSGNRIKFIDDSAFVGIESTVRNLHLGGNELIAVPGQPLSNLSSLRALSLDHNKIASLVPEDFDAMGGDSLSHLLLANNTIQYLPGRVFRSLKRLSGLNLSGNVIESIHPLAFEGNEETLEMLNLDYNRLEEIPAASLKNLKRMGFIYLRGNDICKVRKDDFQPLGKTLKSIHLQNNSLKYVDPEAFIGLDVLRSLSLQSNQLNSVPFETYSTLLDTLEEFDIHDNPLHCDCNLFWLANWINGRGSGIVQMANETSCVTPEDQTEMLLAEVTSDQLVCRNFTPSLSEPCCNCITNDHGRLSSNGFTTFLQLGFVLLITVVLGTGRLF